ncbi:MAG: ribbon-helix-helix protein, CopG family [Streptosporangiales bacterium]|nr:ribbon-helix-helix protein, CopG family [Streptosporangiales bacterium]
MSLTEEQKRRLDAKAAETGLSLSDLIRRAVDRYYMSTRDADADVTAIRQAVGAWQDRDFDGEPAVFQSRREPSHHRHR